MANLRRSPYLPSRRLRSSRSSRSRSSWPIIFTLGCIVAFSAVSLFYVAHSTVWNEALHKLDIQKNNLDQSHLPPAPPPPRVDKQQQLQQRQGSENNNLRAPKKDDEDSYPGKRNYNILFIYWSLFTFYVPLNIIFDGHTSSYNAKHCTSLVLYCSNSPSLNTLL